MCADIKNKSDRLLAIIQQYNEGNKARFAEKIGVSPQTINSWINRNTYDIDLIYAKCAGISGDWLLSGKGNMLIKEREISDNCPVATRAETPNEGIPLIPISAMAGFARGEVSVMDYECERYIIPAFRNADYLIRVSGDSMTPKYLSGDLVACKKLPLSDMFFQWNKTYVLDTEQGALIKRIKKGSDSEHLLIVSENPEYGPFELRVDQINAVAIVLGLIRIE